MGRLVVIEGLDGSGKRTLGAALVDAFQKRGAKVAQHAFPRYGESVHADLVSEALHGRLGDVSDSVHGMAVLFALDRHGARDELLRDLENYDIVLVDRYIASNAAYQAARLHQDEHGEIVEWIRQLEVDRLGLPVPDRQLLLRVPVDLAATRAATRDRVRDTYEKDGGLQARCAALYDGLARIGWLAPWQVLDGSTDQDFDQLSKALVADA
ncbi:dTMP kinase [Kibdelosporangium philippinense]|uniref:Thymidylate kinase n=1 Tax=Kibdelosporangium philippinense TaxID=211113 RepID=A0ABS8ZE67_9PSEU|nr:dTMP kinase [Kibdelosporangium philippinense]MCE7006080.1 dTMP kinase [Kibdelosporangium philippinense]